VPQAARPLCSRLKSHTGKDRGDRIFVKRKGVKPGKIGKEIII